MHRGVFWLILGVVALTLVGCGGGGDSGAEAAERDLGSSAKTSDATPTPVAAEATGTGAFTCEPGGATPCDLLFSKPESAQNASKHTNELSLTFNPNGGPASGKVTAELTMSDGNCEMTASGDLTGKFDPVTRFFNGSGTLTTTKTGACTGAAAKDGDLSWTATLSADGKSVSGQLKQESAAFPFALSVQ